MKNKIRIMTIFFIMIIPINGISQNKIFPSLELGFTFSQFPSKDLVVTWQISDSSETRTNPLVGPVIGISSNLHLRNKLQLIYGFNYQVSGTKIYSYSHWTDPNIYPSSFFKYWQTLKIHKLTLPIALGYEIKLKKISPMIFLGIKPNLLISAKSSEKSYHSQWTESIKTNTNLFTEKTSEYTPPKRIINQLSFGFRTSLGRNLAANFSYNLGHNYFVSTYWVHTGMTSMTPFKEKTQITCSDYLVTLQYNLIKK